MLSYVRRFFAALDTGIDRLTSSWALPFRRLFPIISIVLVAALVGIFVVRTLGDKPGYVAGVINTDLQRIVHHLEAIDRDCNILSIDSDKGAIDFLNVASFRGSEVGCLNLAHPDKWRGPYVDVNPSVQGFDYQIARAADGYVIFPGDGVKLPTRITMGKDLVITPQTAIKSLLQEHGSLNYRGIPLAIILPFKIGDWDSRMVSPEALPAVAEELKKFNESLPYTQRQPIPGKRIHLARARGPVGS